MVIDLYSWYFECSSNAVQRPFSAPEDIHRKTALGILKYHIGTSTSMSSDGFADVDYASEATDRRSMSGKVSISPGEYVCWFSITPKCITLSASEMMLSKSCYS